MSGNDQAASIKACAMRVTRLAADGSTPAGSSNMIVTSGLIKLDVKHVFDPGVDITVLNACGDIAYTYKDSEKFKRVDLTVTYSNPDVELSEMITNGSLITAGGQSIGFSAPAVGTSNSTGVCLEVWAKAWLQGGTPAGVAFTDGTTATNTTITSASASFTSADIGRTISGTGIPAGATITAVGSSTSVTISAATTATATGVTITVGRPGAFWRYVFPKLTASLGDFALENTFRQQLYDGPATENLGINSGPNNDFPAGMVGSRAYSYFRDSSMPTPAAGYQATPAQ